jgi:protein-tyrosine phosphatase
MLDLHAHVLPGIDDGPADDAEAVAFAAEAAADGTRVMAATPHVRPDHPRVRPEELATRVARLEWALARADVDLELVVGGEVDLTWALEADDNALRAVSYGQEGYALLLETPYGELPGPFETLVAQLTARGYVVLLAHPERNPTYQRDPRRLLALTEQGVLLQVTASALTSTRRASRTRVLAEALVREQIAHVVASDGHGGSIQRASLAAGAAAVEQLASGCSRWFVEEAPAAILSGEPLPPRPVAQRSGRMSRWLGRS